MKTKIAILLSILIILGCSKSSVAPTQLKITVVNNLGNPVSGVSVNLYGSVTSFNNLSNPINVDPVITGADGVALFSGLSSINYWWLAYAGSDGCSNNLLGSVTTAQPLTANIINAVNTIINDTGILTFTNTSSNPYLVKVNGTTLFTATAGSTTSYRAAVGGYSIEVIQQSGYAVSPTDETFTGNVTCGSTLTTTFPI